jgi:site-specific recombinase XerD
MPASHPLIEAFLQDLARAGKSPRTVEGYRKDLVDFIAWLEGRYGEAFDPKAVLPEDLRDYRQHLLAVRRAAPATINRRVSALRAFFAYLVSRGEIPSNPAARLSGVRQARAAPKALSEAELRRLLREARRSPNPLHRAVILLLAHTGLRASELCALRLSDVTLSERKGKIVVRGKGEKVREVPLNAEAREALREWLAARPSVPEDALFIGRRGPLTPSGVWRIVTTCARRAGLEGAHPHTLRHTFATRLLREAGADLVTVAEILGHESLNTTARYTRPSEADLEAAVERLG